MAKTIGLAVMSLVWNREIEPAGREGQASEREVTELDPARKVVIKRREMRDLQAGGLSL